MKWLKAVWNRKIDILLLALSIACFSVFIARSMSGPGGSGAGGRIGTVMDGETQRKRAGAVFFADIKTGADLYNMDALWTSATQTANVQIDPQTKITLHPGTFVIIRRPFGAKDPTSAVQLVKGKVDIKEENLVAKITRKPKELTMTVDEAGEAPKVESGDKPGEKKPPAPKEERPEEPEAPKFYPAAGTTFYLAGDREPITFSWGENLSGAIVVKDAGGRQVARIAVQEASFAKTDLANRQSYTWSVIDQNGTVLYGPFDFKIAPASGDIDLKGALDALKKGEEGKEIIMRTDPPPR